MNCRKVSKSRSIWLDGGAPLMAPSMVAASTRPASSRSRRTLARVRMRARTTSRPASAMSAASSTMVSITSVTWLALAITRS